jgi:hypothetical protein
MFDVLGMWAEISNDFGAARARALNVVQFLLMKQINEVKKKGAANTPLSFVLNFLSKA